MADDKAKKTKIDLKARLKKDGAPGPAPVGAIPAGLPGAPPPSDPGGSGMPSPPSSHPAAPAAAPSRPAPAIAPPPGLSPGLSPGIPIPPFAQPARSQPKAEPKPTAAQQTIKVEIGEEIEHERKVWRGRIILGVIAGVVIGGAIGFVGGGSKEKGDRAKRAAEGAEKLEADVKATVPKLKDLASKLSDASDKLKSKSYPEDLATTLSGLTIPFEPSTLDNKDVGSLSKNTLRNVLAFTSAVEALNKSRESLKNIVSIAKDPITKAWKEEQAPVANFSVVFRKEGDKAVAELVPNKEPFAWKGDFPADIKLTRLEGQRSVEKSVKRWTKGDVTSDTFAIPVDPKTVAAFTSEQLIGKLIKGVYDMRTDLEGNKENPTNETPGLVKMAEDLVNELHKASLNK